MAKKHAKTADEVWDEIAKLDAIQARIFQETGRCDPAIGAERGALLWVVSRQPMVDPSWWHNVMGKRQETASV